MSQCGFLALDDQLIPACFLKFGTDFVAAHFRGGIVDDFKGRCVLPILQRRSRIREGSPFNCLSWNALNLKKYSPLARPENGHGSVHSTMVVVQLLLLFLNMFDPFVCFNANHTRVVNQALKHEENVFFFLVMRESQAFRVLRFRGLLVL